MAIQIPGASLYHCVVLCEQTTHPALALRPLTWCDSKGKHWLGRQKGRLTCRGDNSVELKVWWHEGRVEGVRERRKARGCERVESNLLAFGRVVSPALPPSCSCLFPLPLSFICTNLPDPCCKKMEGEVRRLLLALPPDARLGWGPRQSSGEPSGLSSQLLPPNSEPYFAEIAVNPKAK